MIFDMVSLDYQETLMAAAGFQAEEALHTAMKETQGKYLLLVDGSIPMGQDGAYSCIAGRTNLDLLKEAASGAAAIVVNPRAGCDPAAGQRRGEALVYNLNVSLSYI